MNECPFCGAEQIGHAHNQTIFNFDCGTWAPSQDLEDRSRKCYERQLSKQTDLLRKALEVAKLSADLMHGNVVEDVLILTPKAQSLVPAIERALEKVK